MSMFIILKKYIKTSFILLLFFAEGTSLYANGFHENGKTLEVVFFFSEDTVLTNQPAIDQKVIAPDTKFILPEKLVREQINFRINSNIIYLAFNNFIKNDAEKIFYGAWLKERELKKLTLQSDSLRKVYSNAPFEQKEKISGQILQSEKRSITLNEEIPAMFQKARELEDQYWQTASPDEIAKFQVKTRLYKDSITQEAENKNLQLTNNQPEIPDTITFYNSAATVVEKKPIQPNASTGIIYKIQIGAFKGKIPESANRLIKKLSIIRKIDNYIDAKGVKIYTTGNLRLYKEAETMQNQVKQEGVKNAVINAYQNGEKITVSEARKLNNEL